MLCTQGHSTNLLAFANQRSVFCNPPNLIKDGCRDGKRRAGIGNVHYTRYAPLAGTAGQQQVHLRVQLLIKGVVPALQGAEPVHANAGNCFNVLLTNIIGSYFHSSLQDLHATPTSSKVMKALQHGH